MNKTDRITVPQPREIAKEYELTASDLEVDLKERLAQIRYASADVIKIRARVRWLKRIAKLMRGSKAAELADRVREYAHKYSVSGYQGSENPWEKQFLAAESAYRRYFNKVAGKVPPT